MKEIIHYLRPDSWNPSTELAWGEEFARDAETVYDGVPTLHLSGTLATSPGGAVLWAGRN